MLVPIVWIVWTGFIDIPANSSPECARKVPSPRKLPQK